VLVVISLAVLIIKLLRFRLLQMLIEKLMGNSLEKASLKFIPQRFLSAKSESDTTKRQPEQNTSSAANDTQPTPHASQNGSD